MSKVRTKEGGEGKVLVRMEKELGRNPRTKYFISICPPEVPQEAAPTVPDQRNGGFSIPTVGNRGSSDWIKPYVPTPGDVRRMFGSDKIDAKPEYISSADPDWSKHTPESREEVERKIRMWKEATDQAEREFEDSVSAKTIAANLCNRAATDLFNGLNTEEPDSREFLRKQCEISEGKDEQNKSIDCGILIKSPDGKKLRRKDKRVVIVEPSKEEKDTDKITGNEIDKNPTKTSISGNDDENRKNPQIDSIFNPKTKKSRKAFATAVDIVKRMNHSHWKTIDSIYYILKTKQSINYQYLSEQMTKIIKDIYGMKSYRTVLSKIDNDQPTAVIKVSKLLLNLYQEASYENIEEEKKYVSLYSRKNKKTKNLKPKLNVDDKSLGTSGTKESIRINRCEACHFKQINASNDKKQIKKIKSKDTQIPWNSNKSGRTADRAVKISKKPIPKENVLVEKNPSETNVCPEKLKVGPTYETDIDRIRPSSSPPDLGSSRSSDETLKDTVEDPEDPVETFPQFLESQMVVVSPALEQSKGPERMYMVNLENSLFTLFAASEEAQAMSDAVKRTYDANEYSKEYFNTTLNLFWLNEKLENNLEMHLQIEGEDPSDYEECDSSNECALIEPRITEIILEESESSDLSDTKLGFNKAPLCSKLLSMANECKVNRNYISVFVSVMFGIAAAYFSKDEDFSKDKLTIKNALKTYLKTFLLGALRLVNEI